LPVPLVDPSPEGVLSETVFDFLLAGEEEAAQMLETQPSLFTLETEQMIEQFIASARQSGDQIATAVWEKRRERWQAAYRAHVGGVG
jgi:hypothetical protein